MLSKTNFYIDDSGAYVIDKMTDKTVLFSPVKSVVVNPHVSGSAFLYDVERRATNEPDDSRKPIRYKLKSNFSRQGLALFYECKKGVMNSMCEIEGDTFTLTRNLG